MNSVDSQNIMTLDQEVGKESMPALTATNIDFKELFRQPD